MAIAVVGGYLTGTPLAAVAGATGALGAGIASLQGVYRTRVATMMGTAISTAIFVVIGSLTARSPALSILVLGAWGYLYGILASFGQAALLVGVYGAIALIVFGHYPAAPPVTIESGFVALAGGAVQTLLLVLTWPLYRYPEERRALAAAYRTLAQYARSGEAAQLVQQGQALRTVRSILADPQPFGRRIALAAFQTLLDEAERVRGTLATMPQNDERFAEDRRVAADVLEELAAALETSRAPANGELRARLDAPCSDPNVRALFGQLRAAWRAASIPLRGISLRPSFKLLARFPDLEEPLILLRQNLRLDTPFGRHALRLAIVLALARAMEYVLPFTRSYWITLTAAIVLRPDFTTTFVRGVARIGGTLLGVALATAIIVAVPETPHVDLALTVLFASLSFAFFQINFAVFSLAITAYVVFILALLGQPEESAIVNRVLATTAGGALAMLSYAIWPTWESVNTRRRIVTLLERLQAYMGALFEGLVDPMRRNLAMLNELRSETWKARAAADESLERMLSEPRRTYDISDDEALGIMAASQRIGIANLELWNLYADPSTPALGMAAPFWRAVEDALAGVTAALSGESTVPHSRQVLRDAYETMKASIGDASAPWAAVLLDAGDRLVDSINTMAELVQPG
jgi:uncharacterized membrane protein YccC